MPHFLQDGTAYWGGIHRELGLLMYDPREQHRLAADKVRLYVVAERRLATFVKHLVRTGLVPSRLETWWCPQHAVVMQPWHNARGTWWSHQAADGTWCTGQATPTAQDKKAAGEVRTPQRPSPSTIQSHGGQYNDSSTDRHTIPGHYRPDSRATGAGHGALAHTLGQRDGAAAQPLQPAGAP